MVDSGIFGLVPIGEIALLSVPEVRAYIVCKIARLEVNDFLHPRNFVESLRRDLWRLIYGGQVRYAAYAGSIPWLAVISSKP